MKAEQFIKDYTRRCSNELCAIEDKYGKKVISYHEWLTPEQALSAVAIEREEVIEKACKYISWHQCEYIDFEDFKNYMEGKDDGIQTKFMGSYTTTTETDNGKKYKDYRKDK